MSQRRTLGLLFALSSAFVFACYADRGVLFVGTNGGAGTGGLTLGSAGTTGNAGVAGNRSSKFGCDATPIFQSHTCTITGACHDKNGTAAGFDMVTPGWEKTLVDRYPSPGGAAGLESMCRSLPTPYLWPGVQPARGLFISKLSEATPACGAQMPSIGAPLSADELDCVQGWADALVAAAGTGGAAGTTGAAGAAGGSSGSGGTGAAGFPGCDITPIITAHTCTIQGACHDSNGSAAGLDLTSPGLSARLYNHYPGLGGAVGLESMCRSAGIPYLVPDSHPARGLFLMKLTDPPCGAHMPSIGSSLNATELECIQRWADKVIADYSLL